MPLGPATSGSLVTVGLRSKEREQLPNAERAAVTAKESHLTGTAGFSGRTPSQNK